MNVGADLAVKHAALTLSHPDFYIAHLIEQREVDPLIEALVGERRRVRAIMTSVRALQAQINELRAKQSR